MFRIARKIAVLFGLAVVLSAPAGARAPLEPEPSYSKVARTLARMLPDVHLERLPMGDAIATNALEIYLSFLDFDRTCFLASDIAEFRREATSLDDQLRKGDVLFAYTLFNRYAARVSNRVEHVNRLLDKGFNLDEGETYMWKRKDAAWAASQTEWDELWRKKIKNEYVGFVVSRRLAEENGAGTNRAPEAPNARTNAPAASTNAAVTPAESPAAGSNAVAAGHASTNDMSRAQAPEPPLTPEESIRKRYRQFLTVLEDNDAEWVLQRYLTAFAQAYDPHSEYMSPSTAEDFDISMKLSLFGIGAVLTTEEGLVKVVQIVPKGPADKDGRLKAGDKITAVAQGDGPAEDIVHWPLRKAVERVRGPKGAKVVLTVIPASDPSRSRTVKIDLVRDEVKLEEQAAKGRVEEAQGADGRKRRLGVVALPTFYVDVSGRMEDNPDFRSSVRDVRRILEDLGTNHVEGIVLDLRNNGGGSLKEAVDMTGLFFDTGPVVQVKEMRRVHIMSDEDPAVVYGGPLIVLVNRQSASASEILAAALQDYGRALLVGDSKTHGKGTVQSLLPLDRKDEDMGSLKVTAATFYRMAGGSTQMKGVTPDIVIPSPMDALEIGEEFSPRALPWSFVSPALYRPVANLRLLIPALATRSEKRRSEDPRFVAETQMVARLAALQKMQEVPLALQDRLRMAKEEKSLNDLDPDEEQVPGEKKDGKADIILSEALKILCDLIELQGTESRGNEHPILEDARGGE